MAGNFCRGRGRHSIHPLPLKLSRYSAIRTAAQSFACRRSQDVLTTITKFSAVLAMQRFRPRSTTVKGDALKLDSMTMNESKHGRTEFGYPSAFRMKFRMHSEIAAEPTLAMFAKGQERSFEGGQPMSGFRSTADSVTQSPK